MTLFYDYDYFNVDKKNIQVGIGNYYMYRHVVFFFDVC